MRLTALPVGVGPRRTLVSLGIVLHFALASFLPGCTSPDSSGTQPAAPAKVLRVGAASDPSTLDPSLAGGAPEEQILINLFEGLVEYDAPGAELLPALAESWTSNPESTRFVFTLRRDGRWSNGDPVSAHDFEYSWKRVIDPNLGAQSASLLFAIRNAQAYHEGQKGVTAADVGIHAPDDHHLEVDLACPTPHFPRLLANSVCRPVHRRTVEQWREHWTLPEHMVSNGPFTLVSWKPADRLVLAKNPLYRGAAEVALDQAVYFSTSDSKAMLNLYEAGELDALVTGYLPLADIPRLKQSAEYRSGPFLATYFYGINASRPKLRDLRVRRALSLAIDRPALCTQLLRAGQAPAYALTPNDFRGIYPQPHIEAQNVELARRLMAEGGYPEGANLQFTLLFNSSPLHASVAQAIQGQWQRAFPSIQVQLVNQEWQVYLDSLHRGDFDMVRRLWTGDYDDPSTFLEIMTSRSQNNASKWKSPEYDLLYHEATCQADARKRMEMLARAEEKMLAELPVIPIYSAVTFFLTKPNVRGWESNQLDRHPLKYVRLAP